MVQLRAKQFAGNDSFPGPSFKGSRQQLEHFHAEDREFVNSRKVLEGKARFLREQGCKPNQLRLIKVRNVCLVV